MGYTLTSCDTSGFDSVTRDRLFSKATDEFGGACELYRSSPPEPEDDVSLGFELFGAVLSGSDPRAVYRALVEFARKMKLALVDPQADLAIDLESPGDLPPHFKASSSPRGGEPRIAWADEIGDRD